ncbi:hypothetical protein [Vibrio penaeicida]|nr:hypothetical protein [Vibrio penaeicida]
MMRIAVIGDSVMWGQGIPRHLTYANQLVSWLRQNVNSGANVRDLHQPVTGDYKAHSGAIIGHDNEHHRRPSYDTNLPQLTYFGDLPASYPTITRQLTDIDQPETVDLLLMNGIANDVGFKSAATDFEKTVQKLDGLVDDRLIPFLVKARNQCPNALIIYTGYFPAVSPHSKFESVEQVLDVMEQAGSVLQEIANFRTGNRFADTIIEFAEALTPIDDILGWMGDGLTAPTDQLDIIKLNAYLFYTAMELGAMRAANKVNQQLTASGKAPIWFVHPGLSASKAMFTRQPQVWGLRGDPLVTRERVKMCPKYQATLSFSASEGLELGQNLLTAVSCQKAHMLHPNKSGANQYFARLQSMMTDHHTFSLRKVMGQIAPNYRVRKATEELGIPFNGSLRNLIPHQTLNMLGATLTVQARSNAEKLVFNLHYGDRKFPLVVKSLVNQGAMKLYASEQVVLDTEARVPMKSVRKLHLRCATSGVNKVANVNLQVMINGATFSFDLEEANGTLSSAGTPLPFGLFSTPTQN